MQAYSLALRQRVVNAYERGATRLPPSPRGSALA
jgi:hypothetical protein